MKSLNGLTLAEARASLDRGEVSSLELVDAALDQAQAVNPRVNAFLRIDAEDVRRRARHADAATARGDATGALHGIPLAHKDMFHRAGIRSSYGARSDMPVPDTTASVLSRLDAAGALQLGVLNMSAFAVGPTGHNRIMGDCRNPWNLDHITGGSSSGSAAAVAARATYAALGSDTAGSIRLPAGFCGVTGLKPTYGRVSRAGIMGFSFTLDSVGPIARTAMDCAMIMNAIAGPDEGDPTSAPMAPPDYLGSITASVRGLRIGVPELTGKEGIAADVAAALARSVAALRALGCEIVPIPFPDLLEMDAAAALIIACEGASLHGSFMRRLGDTYGKQIRIRLERGFAVPAPRYLDALRYRAVALARFTTEVFGSVDVLHMPLCGIPVPRLANSDMDAGHDVDQVVAQLTRFTRPFNVLGLPSLSLPIGFSDDAMPLAMQLVGRPFSEDVLLRLGHAFQGETSWHDCEPAMVSEMRPPGRRPNVPA